MQRIVLQLFGKQAELIALRVLYQVKLQGSGTMDKREFCEICNTISVRCSKVVGAGFGHRPFSITFLYY